MRKVPVLIAALCLLFTACSPVKKQASAKSALQVAALTGTWELNLIPYNGGTFDALYPDRKPSLSFDPVQQRFSGYSGCNSINGPLVADSNTISFKGDIAMTLMACTGEGESVFLEQLKRINKFSVSASGKELILIQGDLALMRFHKK